MDFSELIEDLRYLNTEYLKITRILECYVEFFKFVNSFAKPYSNFDIYLIDAEYKNFVQKVEDILNPIPDISGIPPNLICLETLEKNY